ncbi:VWA domain-containing protein [Trueperella pyogenes]|uniref:VWA domain-containing protein n=1 Tax=Trueperella pyogenes TaxID=1661 RepID=UPI00345D2EA3
MRRIIALFFGMIFVLTSAIGTGFFINASATTDADRAHPTKPGEVKVFKYAEPVEGMVNTWDVTLRIEGKDTKKTSDVVLVIDRSRSMNENRRMEEAKKSANAFIDALLPSGSTSSTNKIGIVSFGSDVTKESELSSDAQALKRKVDALSARGGTYTQAGIRKAEEMLKTSKADKKHIVLLSDGIPTFSDKIKNPDKYTKSEYVDVANNSEPSADGSAGSVVTVDDRIPVTTTAVPKSAFEPIRVGGGSKIYSLFRDTLTPGRLWAPSRVDRAAYHHGNSTIAEAGFAKSAGNRMWSIALQADRVGQEVLNHSASANSYYNVQSVDQLKPVFEEIAGSIGSAASDIKVVDPMAKGFEISAARVSRIEEKRDKYSYDRAKHVLTWNPGRLTEVVRGMPDVRFAQLKYRVEINKDILTQKADEKGTYPTNGEAKVSYVDAQNKPQSKLFPVPRVNPVFYAVKKELVDQVGKTKPVERDFTVKIKGPDLDGVEKVRSFTLNAANGGSTGLLTDLRFDGKYTIEEELKESDEFDVTYKVNGEAKREFTIAGDATADVEVVVTNKENSKVTVSATKTWSGDQPADRPESIKLKLMAAVDGGKPEPVEGQEKEVRADDKGKWAQQWTGLPKFKPGQEGKDSKPITYSVVEEDVAGYTNEVISKVDKDGNTAVTITNYRLPDITWKKVDAQKTPLAGSAWSVTGPDGVEHILKDDQKTTGKTAPAWSGDASKTAGTLTMHLVPAGKYTIKETAAPTGYQVSEDAQFAAVVDAKGKVTYTDKHGKALKFDGDGPAFVNDRADAPVIPLTGGVGTFLFVGTGIVLALMAAGLAVWSVRKRTATE